MLCRCNYCKLMRLSLLSFRFFMELNNRIFQTLSEVAGSLDPTLSADHVRSMGLDPQGDRSFLVDLLEVYGFDVTLVIDNPCCPWVSSSSLWATLNSIFTGYLCLLAPTLLHTYKRTHWALKTLPRPWDLHLLPAVRFCATSNPRTFTKHWRMDAKDTFYSGAGQQCTFSAIHFINYITA